MRTQNSILVIGKPNSGKSGFFGQLYARLDQQDQDSFAKLLKTPENIEAINQILDRYAEGKALEHTPAHEFENLELEIEVNGEQATVKYPDYGGEQVNTLMSTRRMNDKWHEHIQDSNNWFLFIRLGNLDPLYDPINKFTEIVKSNQGQEKNEEIPSDQAFYIELLQILLYYKGMGYTKKNDSPHITIVLSCWDEFKDLEKNELPKELLNKHLPLLDTFLEQNWNESALKVVGLSSQGKSLDKEISDDEYIYEEEGYIVQDNGEVSKDLTVLLDRTNK